MIKLFITKADRNGNNYYILEDETKRTFKKSYNISPFTTYDIKIKVASRKQLSAYALNLIQAGYKKIEV